MFRVKHVKRVKKGIVFAGCSFTWGQGLYYYSNLPTLQEPPPDLYDHTLLSRAHIKFKETVRFPRLVANHFETFEVVRTNNGGSNDGIIESLYDWFNETHFKHYDHFGIPTDNFHPNEISHIVFQITQWARDNNELEMDGDKIQFYFQDVTNDFKGQAGKFIFQYLEKNDISLDQLIEVFIKNTLTKVKNCLKFFESKGIKTILIAWPEEYVYWIKNDNFLKNKLLPINYKNNTYNSMQALMTKNKNLIINEDTNFFDVCPKDHHPSLECHQVMAKNIINFINHNEQIN